MSKSHWLIKTEPTSFSIQDLAASPKQTTCWSGVRNYQARNFMRAMQVGDLALFYHSAADPPAVVGVCQIVRAAYPDDTAWDPKDDHFDASASRDNPIWQMVDVRLREIFPAPLPLEQLRGNRRLADMELLRRGSRLSVQPVTSAEFDEVLRMVNEQAQPSGDAARAKRPPRAPGRPRAKRTRASTREQVATASKTSKSKAQKRAPAKRVAKRAVKKPARGNS